MRVMDSRHRLDFIVGLFVTGALLCTIFLALRAAGIADITGGSGYVICVQFEQIGALPPRAPVKSAGVRVGQVQEITFNDDEFIAEVKMVIEDEYAFPADSIFFHRFQQLTRRSIHRHQSRRCRRQLKTRANRSRQFGNCSRTFTQQVFI